MSDRLPPRGKITDRAMADAIARRYVEGDLPMPNQQPPTIDDYDDGIRDEQDRIESIVQRIMRDPGPINE